MKPRLTDRVLRGLNAACARASADLEAVWQDTSELRRESDDVVRSWNWVQDMIRLRAEQKGVSFNEIAGVDLTRTGRAGCESPARPPEP